MIVIIPFPTIIFICMSIMLFNVEVPELSNGASKYIIIGCISIPA